MGRLRTLTILLTIGAWGAATDGAPPDDAAPTAAPGRPAPPAPPGDYVRAAAKLYQSGQNDLAAKYLEAASKYRDMLTAEEQSSLDQYARMMSKPAAGTVDPQVSPVSATSVPPVPSQAMPSPGAPPGGGTLAARGAGPTADPKQSARWMLESAREMLRQGEVEKAEGVLAQVRAMNLRWGLFENDTPNKLAETIEKVRASRPAGANGPVGDKTQAKARLKQARQLLDNNQYEQAEAIAREVAAWNLRYNLIDDTPRKVAEAASVLRKRDQMRRGGAQGQPSQETYDILLQEARQLMGRGDLDGAEAKARQAHATGVAPPLTADSAENVIHEIAMMRARGAAPAAAPAVASAPRSIVDPAVAPVQAQVVTPAESPAAVAEREGNQLLVQGQVEAAKAKFAEATRLQSAADGLPIATPPIAQGDGAVIPAADAPQAPAELPPAADPAAAPASPGESLLQEAKALLSNGRYGAAREAAEKARDGGFGLEVQANDVLSQVALAEQAGSLSLYEAALDSIRKGDAGRARDLLTELSNSPLDDSMSQKVQDLLARLPRDAAGRAAVGATETDAEAVAAQKLNAEVGTKVAEARRLMETDPDKAIDLLNKTLEGVKSAPLSPAVAKTMTRRVEVAIELAKKDKVAFDAKMQDKQARAEIERKRLRILEASKAKTQQLKELMDKARDAYNEGRFADAEMLAKRANEIDPNEVAPVAMVTLSRTRRHFETAKGLRDAQNESNLLAWEDVDRTAVVDKDVIERSIGFKDGGKGWEALTRSRQDLARRLSDKVDPKTAAVRAKLEEPVSLNIVKQPLGEALDFLRQYTGQNIVLDKRALADEALSEATPVDLVVKDIKLYQALKLLLQPLGLTARVENQVILITSPTSNRAELITKAYGVADLVVPLSARTPNGSAEGTGAMPGQAAPAPAFDPSNPNASQVGPNGQPLPGKADYPVTPDMFVPLVQLIKATVHPGTWRNEDGLVSGMPAFGMGAGGAAEEDRPAQVGSITPFFLNISLIIRHTAEVHDDVVDLLRQLRRLQDLQVSIEVRFITVNDSFFEQIGVDFDFSIQSDVGGAKSSFAVPNPAASPTAANANAGGGANGTGVQPYLINPARDHSLGSRTPIVVGRSGNGDPGNFTPDLQMPFTQGSAGVITPFNALTANTGATFGIAFLSDLEVYLFLTAVQGDQRSNLVQAPKVTTFNGAPAFVINSTNRNYVATLTPIVANGAVAFQPTISSFLDGVMLNVTPVVSADRRYVRMTLAPNFQTFIQFDVFTIPAAVSGFLGGSGVINAQVQLPVASQTLVSTTVTVPDGGTVLLGGVKRLREQRQEFGVPILSKTPYINRLFRNIGIGRTTDSLMLMVTPRIIILEEEEERLGIPTVPTVPF